MSTPKYPGVHVHLTAADDNAYTLIAHVRAALQLGDVPLAERKAFLDQVMNSASYSELLRVVSQTVEVS